jgi:hypothetical protein
MLLQIAWSSKRGHALLQTDWYREHVLIQSLTQLHTGIVLAAHDVGHAALNIDLDVYVGILSGQAINDRPQRCSRRVRAVGDASGAGRTLSKLVSNASLSSIFARAGHNVTIIDGFMNSYHRPKRFTLANPQNSFRLYNNHRDLACDR